MFHVSFLFPFELMGLNALLIIVTLRQEQISGELVRAIDAQQGKV